MRRPGVLAATSAGEMISCRRDSSHERAAGEGVCGGRGGGVEWRTAARFGWCRPAVVGGRDGGEANGWSGGRRHDGRPQAGAAPGDSPPDRPSVTPLAAVPECYRCARVWCAADSCPARAAARHGVEDRVAAGARWPRMYRGEGLETHPYDVGGGGNRGSRHTLGLIFGGGEWRAGGLGWCGSFCSVSCVVWVCEGGCSRGRHRL